MFTSLGKLPSHFNFKISPEFPRGFSFHLQPKFPCGFPPPATKIPGDSLQNPRDFARWDVNKKEFHLAVNFTYIVIGKGRQILTNVSKTKNKHY